MNRIYFRSYFVFGKGGAKTILGEQELTIIMGSFFNTLICYIKTLSLNILQ